MAEMTIRLRIDPNTGKKDIVVSLESDADSLPHEHEQAHRALVEKLIAGGAVKATELGQLVIERLEPGQKPGAAPDAEGDSERTPQQQGH